MTISQANQSGEKADADLGPRCICTHHQAVHLDSNGECLADVDGEGNDACGPSDCGCKGFEAMK